jgi:hypothetical protein
MVECLSSKHKALNSNPSTAKKKKKAVQVYATYKSLPLIKWPKQVEEKGGSDTP